MRVQIWNSFSCNNSSDYRLVARFTEAAGAEAMARELATFFRDYAAEFDRICEENDYTIPDEPIPVAAALADKYQFRWDADDILAWGDEGLAYDLPHVAAVGPTLAIYHDYCGGFTGNIERALRAAGAEVEPQRQCPPDLSLRFKLPPGEPGEAMASELAEFFNQSTVHDYATDFEIEPPWGAQRLGGEGEEFVWFREGDELAFKMPFPISGLDDLKQYLANRGATDVDMRLCDVREIASFEMRDVLAELDAMVASGQALEELDLSDRKLRFIPDAVLAMTQLRKLVLCENPLEELPAGIAKLTALEELDVEGCPLTSLPDELAQLTKLYSLDISRTKLHAIPAVVGALPGLRRLRAHILPRGARLGALANATGLEVLDLSFIRPQGKDLMPFPREILALSRLRELDLHSSAIADVPDEITELRELESLNLDGAVGRLSRLPPLHQLPKLKTLLIAGGASNTGKYAPHTLLDGVWSITTLEHLGIDRYGEEKDERGPLTALPDDAFRQMPNLRILDLSFNELETLPESFYGLTKLESVDLQYTKLDRATVERLASTFPKVKLDLRRVKTRFDVDDTNWKAVHSKVKAAAQKLRSDRAGAVSDFEQALALCTPGAIYSDYDELYALYGIVDALGHLRLEAEGDEKEAMTDKVVDYATRALELVPDPAQIWHFTDEGAFQKEVTRRAGNALAWCLMERGELDRALRVANRALSAAGDNGYVYDTKVRILLKAGRQADAFAIVDTILAEDPGFGDFQDIKASAEFHAWQADGRQRS